MGDSGLYDPFYTPSTKRHGKSSVPEKKFFRTQNENVTSLSSPSSSYSTSWKPFLIEVRFINFEWVYSRITSGGSGMAAALAASPPVLKTASLNPSPRRRRCRRCLPRQRRPTHIHPTCHSRRVFLSVFIRILKSLLKSISRSDVGRKTVRGEKSKS